MSTPPAHYTLLQLQQHLGRVIALNLRQPVWIRAEISDVDLRGHGYISLVEQDEWGQLKAKSEAVLWKHQLSRLRKKLGDMLDGILQKGRQVLLFVQPEMHEIYGMKLSVSDIFEEFTIGQMELQRQQTRQKLQQAGLWQLNHQRVLPTVAQRVAVISSREAAGLQDFEQQLANNRFGYQFYTQLFAASVQGANAVKEIPQQFQAIAQQSQQFDCVVMVRGGGSKLDLAEFDHFAICEAVARCPLPVVTGIGHDIDQSLSDEVAHTAQKTPTAVAEFLIARALEYEAAVHQTAQRIVQGIQRQHQEAQLFLQRIKNRAQSAFQQQINDQKALLREIEQRFIATNPKVPLQRGFVLLYDQNDKQITTPQQLKTATLLKVRFEKEEVVVKLIVDN